MSKRIRVREQLHGYVVALPPAETEPPPEFARIVWQQGSTAGFPVVLLDKTKATALAKRTKGGRVVHVKVTIEAL